MMLKSRGYSLVEVLIALAVLTIGAYGSYGGFQMAARRSNDLERTAQARLLAHQAMQELLACDAGTLAAWTPPLTPSLLPDTPFLVQYRVDPAGDGPRRWTVQVGSPAPDGGMNPAQSALAEGIKRP